MRSIYILIIGGLFVLLSAYISIGLTPTIQINSMIFTLGIGTYIAGFATGMKDD